MVVDEEKRGKRPEVLAWLKTKMWKKVELGLIFKLICKKHNKRKYL